VCKHGSYCTRAIVCVLHVMRKRSGSAESDQIQSSGRMIVAAGSGTLTFAPPRQLAQPAAVPTTDYARPARHQTIGSLAHASNTYSVSTSNNQQGAAALLAAPSAAASPACTSIRRSRAIRSARAGVQCAAALQVGLPFDPVP
jgi:hypothetical protein